MASFYIISFLTLTLFHIQADTAQFNGPQGRIFTSRVACDVLCFEPDRRCVPYEGGTFYQRWQCLADCGAPESPGPNGDVSTPNGTTFEKTAVYTCGAGFILEGGPSERTCMSSSQWSGEEPACVSESSVMTCPPLDDICDGTLMVTGDTEGDTATYSCNMGFSFVGVNNTRTCTNGTWTGYPPPAPGPCCEPVTCPLLSDPADGSVVSLSNFLNFGSVATYECNTCYNATAGDLTRTCQQNGTWSGSEPVCGVAVAGYEHALGNSCYQFFNDSMDSWDNALAACKGSRPGAHLVEINSPEEDCFLFTTLKNLNDMNKFLWIGGTDKLMEGTFVWESTMAPIGPYINWKNGEPEDMTTEEDCMALVMVNYQWADRPCGGSFAYICEVEE